MRHALGEKVIQNSGGGNLKGTHRLEDPGVDWRIILKRVLNK